MVGIHVSAAYSRMGRMYVFTSFHIIFIYIWLTFVLPARLNIVYCAASVLPLSFFMWSSIVPLLLIVISRYLYVSMLSIVMFPRFNLVSWFFPIVIVWLLSQANVMWNILANSSVISSIFCSSCLCVCISATSSIQSRHPSITVSPILVVRIFSVLIYLAISSIIFAYSITNSTTPCLMLSRILICLVFPYLVRIVAVMFFFILLWYLGFNC